MAPGPLPLFTAHCPLDTRNSIVNLTARYIFPVAGGPIAGGVLTLGDERIIALEPGPARGSVLDLGNVAILPGLVNAHVHLEFSAIQHPLGRPGMPFADWIRLVIEQFRGRTDQSTAPVEQGLTESLLLGTTTLGEIAQPGSPMRPFNQAAIEGTLFMELIAPTPDRVDPLLELAPQHLRQQDPANRWKPGLSPHAPYSVLPALFAAAVSLCAAEKAPLAFHLAESSEEIELLSTGSGPFRDLFEELGTCHPSLFALRRRPLDYLEQLAAAHRALVIHGNYLDQEEIAFLAQHVGTMSAVYCPRTHAYFGHDPYPLSQLLSAGATVALGTDSRASAPDLSILAEMRFLSANHPEIAPPVVLELGTVGGARALGCESEIGTLEPGKLANLVIVALPEHDAANPHELLLGSNTPVTATWCRGTSLPPGEGAAKLPGEGGTG